MTPASCRSGLAWDTIPGWPVEDADAALEAAGVWAAATGNPYSLADTVTSYRMHDDYPGRSRQNTIAKSIIYWHERGGDAAAPEDGRLALHRRPLSDEDGRRVRPEQRRPVPRVRRPPRRTQHRDPARRGDQRCRDRDQSSCWHT